MNLPFKSSLLCGALIALCGSANLQAATPAEIAKLGNELTPAGAEKSGNADGTIPAWDGGLTVAPAGWTPGHGDPYSSDKPLYSVNQSNLAQYQSLLAEGQVALINAYPEYRMDVYPSHRSCPVSAEFAQRTKEFAAQSKLSADGWTLEQAVGNATPFPVPQSGAQVMWNFKLRDMAKGRRVQLSLLLPESNGNLSEFKQWIYEYYPWNDSSVKSPADTAGVEGRYLYDVLSPSSRAGELYLIHANMGKPQDSWIYFPGQRRVRRAPSFAYDNPVAGTDGLYFVDQINMFTGAMDRYDFKLVGKQEMLVPYNSYKLVDKSNKYTDLMGKDFLNRDAQRYEQHRVWVVEATVKAGKRHSFGKRMFYIDEDSWNILHVDMYDIKGNLWRTQEGTIWANPQMQACVSLEYINYDLIARRYLADNFSQEGEVLDLTAGVDGRVTDKMFNPGELRRRGER